jgi:hypothetical protein
MIHSTQQYVTVPPYLIVIIWYYFCFSCFQLSVLTCPCSFSSKRVFRWTEVGSTSTKEFSAYFLSIGKRECGDYSMNLHQNRKGAKGSDLYSLLSFSNKQAWEHLMVL